MPPYSLRADGKVIIVTGGYGHLGKAISKSLIFHGAELIVAGRDESKFAKAFSELPVSKFHYLDISNTESFRSLYNEVHNTYGKIDVVINNAFYAQGQSPEDMSDNDWSLGIDGTLSLVFRSMKAVIPFFKRQGAGRIINVSSMYGMIAPDFDIYQESAGYLNPPHYGAAKAGIIQITKYYASYLAGMNIRVNSVSPGPFPSEMVQGDAKFVSRLINKTLVGRIGEPEDVAGIFVFLSSDAADFITGQNFVIDGGWTVR